MIDNSEGIGRQATPHQQRQAVIGMMTRIYRADRRDSSKLIVFAECRQLTAPSGTVVWLTWGYPLQPALQKGRTPAEICANARKNRRV
jgi:hypothetical protein